MSQRPHLPGCVLNPEHPGECTTVPELVDGIVVEVTPPRPSQPLQKVEVAGDAPPQRRRPEDRLRLRDQDWRSQFVAGFKWTFAPVVRDWHGLSLIRGLSIYIAVTTGDLAHDWIKAAGPVIGDKGVVVAKGAAELGFAFALFVLGGFFLAVIVGLGEKYIDKLITIIGVKLGVALVNAPLPDIITEKPPAPPPTRGPE